MQLNINLLNSHIKNKKAYNCYIMPFCKPGVSTPCGNACIPVGRICHRPPGTAVMASGGTPYSKPYSQPYNYSHYRPPLPMRQLNCRPGVSRQCGNACVPLTKACRKTGETPIPRTVRPVCNPERSQECGMSCISKDKICRIGTPMS